MGWIIVLGVFKSATTDITAGSDFNNYTNKGIYGLNINPGGGDIVNYPNDDDWKAGMLVVYSGVYQSGGHQIEQVFYSNGSTSNTIYRRTCWANGWSDWQQIYDTSLLTNSTQLSALASALGVIKSLPNQDPNYLPAVSICYCYNQAHAPGSYFICFTLYNATDGAQIGINSSNELYYRFKGNDFWEPWVKVTATAI